MGTEKKDMYKVYKDSESRLKYMDKLKKLVKIKPLDYTNLSSDCIKDVYNMPTECLRDIYRQLDEKQITKIEERTEALYTKVTNLYNNYRLITTAEIIRRIQSYRVKIQQLIQCTPESYVIRTTSMHNQTFTFEVHLKRYTQIRESIHKMLCILEDIEQMVM